MKQENLNTVHNQNLVNERIAEIEKTQKNELEGLKRVLSYRLFPSKTDQN